MAQPVLYLSTWVLLCVGTVGSGIWSGQMSLRHCCPREMPAPCNPTLLQLKFWSWCLQVCRILRGGLPLETPGQTLLWSERARSKLFSYWAKILEPRRYFPIRGAKWCHSAGLRESHYWPLLNVPRRSWISKMYHHDQGFKQHTIFELKIMLF